MCFRSKFSRMVPLLLALMFAAAPLRASHLYGGELYYTWNSGNLYTVTMILYGDCGGSSTSFAGLSTATPEIEVYNGSSLVKTIYLDILPGSGTEVTPVCAGSIGSTTCNGGTVPGIKRFAYSDTITLGKSSSWKFRFTGQFANGTIAGRSNSITNIVLPFDGSIMSLEATLNNLSVTNSNPTFTTIPTPFFCISVPQEYNQGAVDTESDSLVYQLVDGLDASTSPSSLVTYLSAYAAKKPLATTTGSFTFDTTTGQLSFTPNLAQVSLVVCKVLEYRAGVLIGSCMREMNFIVLSSCGNKSPGGKISSVTGGTATSDKVVDLCMNTALLTFMINPTDDDGDTITVSYAGLPAGATMSITGNSTKSPSMSFSWDTRTVKAGTYVFYVTYQDNGCPLSSKQTVAYSINVNPLPVFTYTLVSAATCVKKAVFKITPVTGRMPWRMDVYSGSTTVHTIASFSAAVTDSLMPGTYRLRLTTASRCYKDTTITLVLPVRPEILSCSSVAPACNGSANGVLTIAGKGGVSPYTYARDAGAYGSSGSFSGLAAGTYVLHIKDANACIKDTTVTLTEPAAISLNYAVVKPLCKDRSTGQVMISAGGGISPYTYALGSGAYGTTALFTGLAAGTYTFHVRDKNNCIADTVITLTDSFRVTATVFVTSIACNGESSGKLIVSPAGGVDPYTYALGAAAYGTKDTFSGLRAGAYTISVKDVNGCTGNIATTLTEPDVLVPEVSMVMPSCFGYADGTITLGGRGGTPFYLYAINSGAYGGAAFTGLPTGTYILHLKDKNGCTRDTTVHLAEPAIVTMSTKLTSPLCYGGSDGTAVVTVTGGTPAYKYSADDRTPQADNRITGLRKGTIIIKVSDANGCMIRDTVRMTEPDQLVFGDVVSKAATCEGYKNGSLFVLTSGGTGKYHFSLDNGVTSDTFYIGNLAKGIYRLTVKDDNNCSRDTVLAVSGYPEIVWDSTQIILPTCAGRADGSFMLYISGGNPPLSYSLLPGGEKSTASFYDHLTAGTYTVRVTDVTSCTKDFEVQVKEPDALKIELAIRHNFCLGPDTNGMLAAHVSGGTAPYVYLWSDGTDGISIRGLANGVYRVRVSDAYNCTDSATEEVVYDNCCTPAIPNAFTPNNDGRNDQFNILYKGNVVLKEFSIYNRYGQQVFTTKDITQGWDGTFHGQQLDLGVYYYYIRMLCGNDQDHEVHFKGDITLIR